MKYQALFSSIEKSKKNLKTASAAFLFGLKFTGQAGSVSAL